MSDERTGETRGAAQAQRCREYADLLERAPVHDDMGLSLTHSQCADVLREAASLLASSPPVEADADLWGLVEHMKRVAHDDVFDDFDALLGYVQGWAAKLESLLRARRAKEG